MHNLPVITFTSDFGTKDYAVPVVKATLLKKIPQLQVVDVSHEVSPYNIVETAFLLNAVYPEFPEKTIHLIGTDAEFSFQHKHLIVSIENHIFIGADNGIFSLLLPQNKIQKIIEIQHPLSETSIFPVKDVFCEVAVKLASGIPMEQLGKPLKKVVEWVKVNPDLAGKNEVLVHVVYVDRFGNLITDISQKLFHQVRKNRKFEIKASSATIQKVYHKYDDFVEVNAVNTPFKTKAGMAMAVFNSLDLLEIALYKSDPLHGGSATDLLGLKVGDTIKILFN